MVGREGGRQLPFRSSLPQIPAMPEAGPGQPGSQEPNPSLPQVAGTQSLELSLLHPIICIRRSWNEEQSWELNTGTQM